ncbi:YkvI family membrane protein [Brevundimonas diminuta]|uniref:YkvI family membrane protein n=1 Tax=Brevundimonas diminuta TaxID=293 RepID=UPI003D04B43C
MSGAASATAGWFQRLILPGLAFKAAVIGGGYATGRELVEFFMPGGPWGGLGGILVAMLVWSVVCAMTFVFARMTGAGDYRSFFRALLGRGWVVFEIAYFVFIVLVLAVFGAAAGEIGVSMFGWPPLVGTLLLIVGVVGFAAFGNAVVEALFKYVSFLLYAVYAIFLVLCLAGFGDQIAATFTGPAVEPVKTGANWALSGLSYASYNVIGAVVILPVVRHMTSRRDAVVAGLIAGPLAMAPALLFFVCMMAFYPGIGAEKLPSDFMLAQLNLPIFRALFQLMIFAALLESGVGFLHAINERVSGAWAARRDTPFPAVLRGGISGVFLIGAIFLAAKVGLIDLIASGYGAFGYIMLAIFVLPLMTLGLWRVMRK